MGDGSRMKVVFSLPQLRDHSYISVINRSVHHRGNNLVNQLNCISVNESIYQSANRSFSPNSSQIKNASNNFSHVRMSSPNKEESNVPEFNPPLDQNGIFTNLLGANHKSRTDARNSSSISLPQISPMVIQNNRVNSRHESAIESPEIIQRTPAQPITEFLAPNMGDKLGSNRQPIITDRLAPNKGDDLGTHRQPIINGILAPNVRDDLGSHRQ